MTAASGTARALRPLLEFLRFPSVSGDPARAGAVARCAEWLAAYLRRTGFPFVRVVPTPGHPIVYAEWRGAPGRPTVLLYGHYDVQPPGAAGWTNPPFDPVVRGGAVYARGAADDKGPVIALVDAVGHWFRRGGPPVNVKLLVEGEEEIGSPHLPAFLRRHRRRLAADVAVVADTPGAGADKPAIVTGLRGLLRLRVDAWGPPRDLHSGLYGGAIQNPVHVLAGLLAGLHDANGQVTVPGFYDDVRPLDPAQRAVSAGPLARELYRNAGVNDGFGETGFTPYERATVRPAVVVSGVAGGDPRPGGAAVIPSRAAAAINVRLVPDQNPERIAAGFRKFIADRIQPGVRVALQSGSGSRAAVIDPAHAALRVAVGALGRAFGTAPALLRCGGTIPVVRLVHDVLGAPTILLGVTRPTDRQHGPDERFHLEDLRRSTEAVVRFLAGAAGGAGSV